MFDDRGYLKAQIVKQIWVRSQDWLPIQEQQWGPWLSACSHMAAGASHGWELDSGEWYWEFGPVACEFMATQGLAAYMSEGAGQWQELGSVLWAVPWKAGEAGHSLCSLFSYQNKLSLARKLSVGSEQCWSGGQNDTVQAKMCYLCVVILRLFCSAMC